MFSSKRKDRMDLTLPLTTKESLLPPVQLCLNKLTEAQWVKLQSGSTDKATEDNIANVFVDIIDIISTNIYEAIKKTLSEGRPGFVASQNSINISNKQVQDSLGDVVSQTIGAAMGFPEDFHCISTVEITSLMSKEIKERVNSELSDSSGKSGSSKTSNSQSSKKRVKKIVKHMVKVLQKFAAKMSCTSKKGQQSQKTEAAEPKTPEATLTEEPVESEVSFLTPVTPLHEDGPEDFPSGGRFSETKKAIEEILDEQLNYISGINTEDISEEERRQFVSSTAQDTEKAASEILKDIIEEFQLDGTPRRVSESETKTSFWKKVDNKIKAFFVYRFAKETMLKFVARLRRKLNSPETGEKAVLQLLDGLEYVLENMMPSEENQDTKEAKDQVCLYKHIAAGISSGQHKLSVKHLGEMVYHHLKPTGKKLQVMGEIRTEVDMFMKMMWNWLNQQVQEHERKKDRASAALSKIKRVVGYLPALTKRPWIKESDTSTSVFKGASASVTEEPAVSDNLPASVTEEPAVSEKVSASVTEEPAVSEKVSASVTEESAALDKSDEASRGTTVRSVERREKMCLFLVTGLVNQILSADVRSHLSQDVINTVIVTLKKMFSAEMTGSVLLDLKGHDIKKIVKAVQEDLCKKMGTKTTVQMHLLLKEEFIYKEIVDSLKKHLMKQQKKSCCEGFFRTLYRVMAKPYNTCF
uniref:uncharacterized protein LOC124074927 n=1 Tax=Scatophagus argus TaxID=75038 RepID=UPI001ED7D154|nr:uncharacterized protein LOC124074927 [Scatophagus argus]